MRKQVTDRTWKELNIRNNVEATIFQLGYHYPNAKSRYRGLIKHEMWANLLCFWINFVRIANYVANGARIMSKSSKSMDFAAFFCPECENKTGFISVFTYFNKMWRHFIFYLWISKINSDICRKIGESRILKNN